MFSYEDRLRAVQLYIKLGKRIGLTIRQLGYPTKNALGNWYREYEACQDLRASYARQPRYSDADKRRAVDHYLDHGRCIAVTIMALGYPSRALFSAWLQELHPQIACVSLADPRAASRSQAVCGDCLTRQSSADYCRRGRRVVARCTSGRINCSARRIRIDEAPSKTPPQAQIKQPWNTN